MGTENTKVLFCRECEQPFHIPIKRGRPPKICEGCRGNTQPSGLIVQLICRFCNQEFEHPRKAGNRPVKCPTCRQSPTTGHVSARAKERVDRLMDMLAKNKSDGEK